jgi:hypothetical protein
MIYHVTPKWDGKDLESAASRLGECEAIDMFMAKWETEDASFAQDQVTKIFFYLTLAEATEHQATYGGEILAIDDTYITIKIDEIEGFPSYRGPVAAEDIKRA